MPETESFSLFSSVKTVRELLRRKLADGAGHAHGELEAGLQEIEALWEELRHQSYLLASERQRYCEFFEYAPDAYLVTDCHGLVREANRAASELLGATPSILAGKPIASFIAELDRREFRAHLVRASAQPDGEVSAWHASVQPRDAAPQVRAHFRVRAMPEVNGTLAALCWLVRRD